MEQPCHTIKFAARFSGLSTHVIRVWEKRYGAVVPGRTDSKHRLYSDADLKRLKLLAQATHLGHSIGNIAWLSDDELKDLLKLSAPVPVPISNGTDLAKGTSVVEGRQELESLIGAIRNFDKLLLDKNLAEGAKRLGMQGLLMKVVAPLAQQIGELWQNGELTAAHEHFASAAIREYLLGRGSPYAETKNAPVLVVATPAGQLHELGAAIVAYAAANMGWRVLYLGPGLPAAEIAGPTLQGCGRAVALSIVYPADDPGMADELSSLRKLLPDDIVILAGGRAVSGYRIPLEKIRARQIEDLPALYRSLDELRAAPAARI